MPSFGQRLGISVVLVLTLLGFLTPQPSAASAVPKAQPEASIQQGGESPATTTIDGQPLPPPVLARVQVLYEAAGVRDYEAIRRELPADLSDFTYSFGDPPGDPIPYWQQLKGRPELEDPVAHLPRLLRHPPATDGVSIS